MQHCIANAVNCLAWAQFHLLVRLRAVNARAHAFDPRRFNVFVLCFSTASPPPPRTSQLLILASAVCLSLAYPGYEPYHHYGLEHSSGGYEHHGYADDAHDFGQQHAVASQRIDGHGHEALDHHQHQHEEHEEHVDYYVS